MARAMEAASGVPGWVKALAAAALFMAVTVAVLHLLGLSPARH